MTNITLLDYQLIEDTFSRPMYYANVHSFALLDRLNSASEILTDEDSQSKIKILTDGIKNSDGNIAKTVFVEEHLDLFKDLNDRIFEAKCIKINAQKGTAMDYQTFVEQLNEKELISKIEKALESHVNIFVDSEEDSSVTNRFNVKITIVTEKMDRFFNSEEVYLFKVDLDYEDVYEDAEVSIPINVDQMMRLVKMAEVIDKHFMQAFEGE